MTTTTEPLPVPDARAGVPDARAGVPGAGAGVQTAGVREVLTAEHGRVDEALTAFAAPVAATAAPVAATAAPVAATVAPAVRAAVPAAPGSAPGTAGRAPEGGGRVSAGAAAEARWVGTVLFWVAIVALPVVGVIGFATSYRTLEQFAQDNGFGRLSWGFPIGIDVSIIGLLAMDLVMIRAGRPKRSLLPSAHLMTAVTIVLNTTAALPEHLGVLDGLVAEPTKALSHAVMPFLFVLGVGALRHWLKATTDDQQAKPDRIPLHRWALAPVTTARLYRRMRLATVTSYKDMVQREQDLGGYVTMLKQKLGGDLSKASDIQKLPMTMAPRGFTVEQALALPEEWERQQEERQRQEEERAARKAERARLQAEQKNQEAERQRREAERREEEASRARIAKLNRQADEDAAGYLAKVRTHEAAGQAEAARVLAEQARQQAERRTQIEAEALESVEAAELLRKAAEDEKETARLEADAEAERRRAQAEQTETARLEADAETEKARKAEAEKATAKAAADTQAEREREATARHRIAVLEAEAQTADDWAGLSPRQRKARQVARMIVAAGGGHDNVEAVTLADIKAQFGAERTQAGELRQEAAQLLAGGYDPMTAYQPQSRS